MGTRLLRGQSRYNMFPRQAHVLNEIVSRPAPGPRGGAVFIEPIHRFGQALGGWLGDQAGFRAVRTP